MTADELLVKPPVDRVVAHPYSDAPADGMTCRCYDFNEVFAEKLRTLSERGRRSGGRECRRSSSKEEKGMTAVALPAVRAPVPAHLSPPTVSEQ